MTDPIPRLNAALEGRYRIERELGAGGMATVYLARDVRHNRSVALKVLKPELAAIVGAERFLVEIETTANLQHPHILPLFDSGEADGFLFYVMPYVEGESLRERLDREHQLPVDEAVQIAANVAEALDYAHARGVIHRDIKPANILLQSGKPVVSDFGIALAVSVGGAGRLTETGLSLGTPHYMSPEQATGDSSVGAATDIYALGCVLYEMLVGEPPYVGSTPQAILGKIIQAKPVSATEARRTVPANVDAVVRRALEKVPADRFATASALARALSDPAFRHGAEDLVGTVPAGRWKAVALVAASLAAVLGVALVGALQPQDPPPLRVARFEAPFREGQGPTTLASNTYGLSPDGSMLIFNRGEGAGQLWMRRWDDLEAIPIRGTAAGGQAVVAPDGELIAFNQRGEIQVLSLAGGVTRTVGRGFWPRWAPNGDLYYVENVEQGSPAIMRAPSGGGAPHVVRADPGDLDRQLVWDFLPDGARALMMSVAEGDSVGQLGVIHLETGAVTLLGLTGDWPIFYTSSGHLLYWTDSTAMAASFDPESLDVGAPVRVLENVSHFDVSRDGTLAYSTFGGAMTGRTNLVFVTPEGGKEVLSELEGITWFPRFSPDGTRLAYGLSETFNPNIRGDLWVIDVARGARTRVTFDANNRWYPIWTRDGTRLTHADAVGNENRVLSTMADGSGGVDTIFDVGPRRFPTSWSPDGRTLAYYQGGQGAVPTRDIWMLRVDGPEPVESPLIQTEFGELGAIFSPDGRWVVYVSDKSGQLDVYARPFPGPGPEVTVSVGGGIEPVWGPDGNEIYYRRPGELMVAPVQRSGSTLSVGAARRVMPDAYLRATQGGAGGMANYDVTPDGTGFVMIEDVSGAETVEPARLFVVFNWLEELKRLVPTN